MLHFNFFYNTAVLIIQGRKATLQNTLNISDINVISLKTRFCT